jgi:hypothetical protein
MVSFIAEGTIRVRGGRELTQTPPMSKRSTLGGGDDMVRPELVIFLQCCVEATLLARWSHTDGARGV